MLLPFGALSNPLAQRLDLAIGQFQTGVGRRHAKRFVAGIDAPDHLARAGIALDDGAPASEVRFRGSFAIEPQRNLFSDGVASMAAIAFIGKNRTHVAIE